MPLAPHIIEWIKKREEEKKRREERPQPQLPVPEPMPEPERKKDPNDPDGDRGVIIIEPDRDEHSSRDRGVEIISFF